MNDWIRSAQPDDFWIFSAFLLAAALWGFYAAFKNLIRKRIIEDTPTSRIRSAAQGYVELAGHGILLEGEPVISPLTGYRCVWYHYKIEEHRGSGKNSRWVTIEEETSPTMFKLVDDTGECVILPEGAEVTPGGERVWSGSSRTPPKPPVFKTHSTWFSGFTVHFGIRHFRFTEEVLFEQAPIYAIGLFKSVGGSAGKFDKKADVRDLLREWKQDSEQLLHRFDFNDDGEIDLDEWEAVTEAAYREVEKRHAHERTLPAVHTLQQTKDRRRPFLLSAHEQPDLLKRYHMKAVFALVAFITAGPLVAWMILVRLAS